MGGLVGENSGHAAGCERPRAAGIVDGEHETRHASFAQAFDQAEIEVLVVEMPGEGREIREGRIDAERYAERDRRQRPAAAERAQTQQRAVIERRQQDPRQPGGGRQCRVARQQREQSLEIGYRLDLDVDRQLAPVEVEHIAQARHRLAVAQRQLRDVGMLDETSGGAGQAAEIVVVDDPEFAGMVAQVEFDAVDFEAQRVAESVEAVLEALAGSAAVTDNVKLFTNHAHRHKLQARQRAISGGLTILPQSR